MNARLFLRRRDGATLVEFSLIAPLLFIITFGIFQYAFVFYQIQSLDAAARMGVRIAATRASVITGIPDCGTGVTAVAGQRCATASGSRTWTSVTCGPGGQGGGTACANLTTFNRVVAEMQRIYPRLVGTNVRITYSASGLGFQGLGRPVPLVTVTITGVPADMSVLGAFGVPAITLPDFATTIPAEDLTG